MIFVPILRNNNKVKQLLPKYTLRYQQGTEIPADTTGFLIGRGQFLPHLLRFLTVKGKLELLLP